MVSGPALRRERPDNVPALTLNGLPGYVTSSDEGDDWDSAAEQAQQQHSKNDGVGENHANNLNSNSDDP